MPRRVPPISHKLIHISTFKKLSIVLYLHNMTLLLTYHHIRIYHPLWNWKTILSPWGSVSRCLLHITTPSNTDCNIVFQDHPYFPTMKSTKLTSATLKISLHMIVHTEWLPAACNENINCIEHKHVFRTRTSTWVISPPWQDQTSGWFLGQPRSE